MADHKNEAIIEKVREIAERVGGSEGIEIVEVELVGAGPARVLRNTIDKGPGIDTPPGVDGSPGIDKPAAGPLDPNAPQGVTHADCELISHEVGTILDIEDVIPGEHYTLEVSSPGIERKLSKPREFERFVGQKVKIVLRQPIENQKRWVGALKSFSEGIITLEPVPGKCVTFPIDQVEKANLKFEW